MWKRVSLLALVAAVLTAVPVLLTERALRIAPERRTPADRRKALDIAGVSGAKWSDAQIEGADGAQLKGWAFLPLPERDAGKAVILLHGAGDTRRGMLGFARFFAQHGYATLVVDSRGHGVSSGPEVTYGVLEKDDTHRWASYLLGLRPQAKLYGLGMSMGAAILIQALDTEPRFRAIVAECSYASFREAAAERIPRLTGLPAFFAPPVVDAAFFYARLRYGIDLESATPLEALRRAHTPVLLIHGLADRNTAPEQSRELHAANPKVSELWEVPNAKHVQASVVAPREFEERVLRWFDK